ncbi:MAG TPA: DUF2911 domain-containing protein, partial [Puia sp.]|nr:DUF2911 domain-containing protein [Puia sp.]
LFMTPGEKEWSVIFNSQTGQWGIKNSGDANLDPAKNVLEVKVKPKTEKDVQEKLTYTVEDKLMDKGFSLRWDKLKVFVSIK